MLVSLLFLILEYKAYVYLLFLNILILLNLISW